LANPDLIIIPGSKNTRHDMEFLRRSGLASVLLSAAARSIPIFGICGGYQLLGKVIRDPNGVEGIPGETLGLGLLDVETTLEMEKELSRVEAISHGIPFLRQGTRCGGYEIHMGRTVPCAPSAPLLEVVRRNGASCSSPSGTASPNNLVFGWYLHGFFENEATRQSLLTWLTARKGLEWSFSNHDGNKGDDQVFNRLADALSSHVDLERLF
jgi:adenosylcobyric acid synthase